MLLHIGMADAYAMAMEYVKMPEGEALLKQVLQFDQYYAHPRFPGLKSMYTDDTEMSCANAKVILEKGSSGTKLDYANAYVEEFIRGGKRKGYSKGFQAILESVNTGKELLSKLIPDSTKNGAAMRAVPFGVLPDVMSVIYAAGMQAAVTHDTREGVFSARMVALMSHFSLYEDAPFSELSLYLKEHINWEAVEEFAHVFEQEYPYNRRVRDGKYSVAINTVHAVLTILKKEKTLIEMLRAVLTIGGDTDSVAALVWGIASPRCREGSYHFVFMQEELELGSKETGAPYLLDLGKQLMIKYIDSPVQRLTLCGSGHHATHGKLMSKMWCWWLEVDGIVIMNRDKMLETGIDIGKRGLEFMKKFRPFLPIDAEEGIVPPMGTGDWASYVFSLDRVKDCKGAEVVLREFFPKTISQVIDGRPSMNTMKMSFTEEEVQ